MTKRKKSTTGASGDIAGAFLVDLARTLDIKETTAALGMTETDARDLLRGLSLRLSTGAGAPAAAEPSAPPGYVDSEKEALAPGEGFSGPVVIHVDGASRGNPGIAGAGAVIADSTGRVLRRLKKYLGQATNNVAEYSALVMALEAAEKMGATDLRVFADSELMVKQINGQYRVKSPDLKPLYERAMSHLGGFARYKVSHVYREANSVADRLANEAIDTRA